MVKGRGSFPHGSWFGNSVYFMTVLKNYSILIIHWRQGGGGGGKGGGGVKWGERER